MLENNSEVIEKIFVLKLTSLTNKDQKWILKKLKKKNKNLSRLIQSKLSQAKSFNLSGEEFDHIFNSLNLDRYFEKNDLDKKIDILNYRLNEYADKLMNDLEFYDLVLFLYCDDSLQIKKTIIKEIISSEYFVSTPIDIKVKKNDKINAQLINYLYSKYLEETY